VTAVALTLIAVAVWCGGPGGRAQRHFGRRPEAGPRRPQGSPFVRSARSPAALSLVAMGAIAMSAVSLLGPVWGGLATAILAPWTVDVVRRLARRSRAGPDIGRRRGIALTLDLLAATLRAGQPVASALALVAPAADERTSAELDRVAGLLRLGAAPPEAWRGLLEHPVLGGVAQTACRSADSGIRWASSLEQLARELRAETRTAAQTRAHRVAIWVMAPLGLCFLPAFVCLGVIPVIVGLAGRTFTTLT
jgi:Flp pilus assembly protein TadB